MAQRLEAEGFFFNPKSPFQTKRFVWAKGISRYEREKFTISYTDPTNYPPEWEPVYAPTAFELLPDGWYLKRYWDERPDGTEIEGWEAMNTDAGIFFLDENPHDAAATAWLWEKKNGR
jgi:hypothetical protein